MKLYQTTQVAVHWLVLTYANLPYQKFPPEKEVWYHYPQQEANPDEDRIFGTFIEGTLAAVARCRLCIPTATKTTASSRSKNSGVAASPGSSCRHEIDACGHDVLYMHPACN